MRYKFVEHSRKPGPALPGLICLSQYIETVAGMTRSTAKLSSKHVTQRQEGTDRRYRKRAPRCQEASRRGRGTRRDLFEEEMCASCAITLGVARIHDCPANRPDIWIDWSFCQN